MTIQASLKPSPKRRLRTSCGLVQTWATSTALIDVAGILYGTTFKGGSNGDGTVFSLDPATRAEMVVHSFGSVAGDGVNPFAGVVDLKGTLYSTTPNGGAYREGTVFSIVP